MLVKLGEVVIVVIVEVEVYLIGFFKCVFGGGCYVEVVG